jgi:hypothetical protein
MKINAYITIDGDGDGVLCAYSAPTPEEKAAEIARIEALPRWFDSVKPALLEWARGLETR